MPRKRRRNSALGNIRPKKTKQRITRHNQPDEPEPVIEVKRGPGRPKKCDMEEVVVIEDSKQEEKYLESSDEDDFFEKLPEVNKEDNIFEDTEAHDEHPVEDHEKYSRKVELRDANETRSAFAYLFTRK